MKELYLKRKQGTLFCFDWFDIKFVNQKDTNFSTPETTKSCDFKKEFFYLSINTIDEILFWGGTIIYLN